MTKRVKSALVPSLVSKDLKDPMALLIHSFLSGRNEKTRLAYQQDIEDFSVFVSASSIKTASQMLLSGGHGTANATALAYRAHLLERGLQAATVNRRLASLRSLVKLARTLGVIPWALEVSNMKTESYRDTRGPGKVTIKTIISQLERSESKKCRRDLAIIRFLYDLGLRRGEVVSLDVQDYNHAARTIAVLGKGRTQKRNITLPNATETTLKAWIKIRGEHDGPLFTSLDRAKKGNGRITGTSVYRVVRSLGDVIGIKIRPHGIRHSAITEACKLAQTNGIGLEEVLQFSRHKDVRTLMVYRDSERDVQGKLAALVAESACERG